MNRYISPDDLEDTNDLAEILLDNISTSFEGFDTQHCLSALIAVSVRIALAHCLTIEAAQRVKTAFIKVIDNNLASFDLED